VFSPPQDFALQANINSIEQYESMRKSANKDPLSHWEQQANKLHWFTQWETILDWQYPHAKWFKEGNINACYNCLDIHLDTPIKHKTAIQWEREDGVTYALTYAELYSRVNQCANGLKSLGIQSGDVVTIYMGMNPEAIISMLACARIGAIHNVVFGGFSSDSLRDRINDSHSVCIITQKETFRRGASIPLFTSVLESIKDCPSIHSVICKDKPENIHSDHPKIHDWESLMQSQSDLCDAVHLESEHPLFFLYTSGSTGKPKGLVHTTGGYLTHVRYTFEMVFDPKPSDIYYCSADIGWITGHSYVVYGPLMHGMTILIYEGALNHPHPGKIWELISTYNVTILYTAPTAIRSFMGAGNHIPKQFNLESLRLLGTVGEPINPEAWIWYHDIIGASRCPIVDTWWQTETGAIMISPLPGATKLKPGSATLLFFGIKPILDEHGKELHGNGVKGRLCIKFPWPGQMRTVYGDHQRFIDT